MGIEDSRKELYEDLERYIQEHWIPSEEEDGHKQDESAIRRKRRLRKDVGLSDFIKKPRPKAGTKDSDSSPALSLEDLIGEVGKSFHEALFEKIDQSGMTDVEVYKRANIDRKLFSKIRNNPAYHPRKSTVLALAIAMRLDMEDTEDLLSRAEYAFSPGSKSDVIVRYFIERRIHDIYTINIALYEHDLPILE